MEKIFELNELSATLDELKGQGKKIVHCHGVFDLIHIGHVRYLEEAKEFGDILLVTITEDKNVKKGPNRPAFTETLRAEALAALEIVDYVAINKWETAVETINLLKPDFYVKGPDYKDPKNDLTGKIDDEAQAVENVGGEIRFTSGITFSSTNLLNTHFPVFNDEQKEYIHKISQKYTMDDIEGYLEKIAQQKVLLIGEFILDEYVYCNALGKSGKEPMLVLKRLENQKFPGGIFSIAKNISDFCRSIRIETYLGEEAEYLDFIHKNISSNIDFSFIRKKGAPTILKKRFLDSYTKRKVFGVYEIENDLINDFEEEVFLEKLSQNIQDYDAVVIADYGHGLITPRIVDFVQKNAKHFSVNTQVNAANIGYHTISKYKKADYVCIHEGELRHDYRSRVRDVRELTQNLLKKMEAKQILITQGSSGSLSFNLEDNFLRCPAFADRVVDRIGAGDTVLGITSLCFSIGMPADLSLLFGNIAGGLAVASLGTAVAIEKVAFKKAIKSLLG